MAQQQSFYLISPYDGRNWLDDEVANHTPVPRVRQFLGGRWETRKEFQEDIVAYYNGARRVLVLKFKDGTTQEQAHRILGQIREGRERDARS